MTEPGVLRDKLLKTMANESMTMTDLTVLSAQNDPYRIDTPAMHRDGKWLADTAASLGLGDRKIHLRGLHYMILGQIRPDGSTYVSDDKSWEWLESSAGKAARWLGYLDFESITDQRNAAPVIRIYEPPVPTPYLNVGINVDIPSAYDITPEIMIDDFVGTQPYKLVMVGEKSSLDAVLGPIANSYKADLFLPTGDISDTLIYQMARIGAEDGRRMVVFYFADADPSGHNMGIALARKLQALKDLRFDDLDFEVHRVALTVDQVKDFGLPSTPLKPTEKRAGAWFAAYGVEQTEIDALATLRPELLRQVAREAMDPFFDRTLERRVFQAQGRWLEEAQAALDAMIDQEQLERIRAEAAEKLTAMREQIDALNAELRVDVNINDLPPIVIPEPETLGVGPVPLLDSDDSFAEQTRRLIASKRYQDGRS